MEKVKYRSGFPTKSSMIDLIYHYPGFTFQSLYPGSLYSDKSNVFKSLTYSRSYEVEHIDAFMTWCYEEHGVEFESHEPYQSPRVGSLKLKMK